MTQSDLAKAIGVNKQTISNIEKGDGYPTFNNLEKISRTLGANPIQLFGTMKEIALFDTSDALDKIDKHKREIQDTLTAADFIDTAMIDKDMQHTIYNIQTVYKVFYRPLDIDENGIPNVDPKTGKPKKLPSMFDQIPFEEIERIAYQLDFIINNYDSVMKKIRKDSNLILKVEQ